MSDTGNLIETLGRARLGRRRIPAPLPFLSPGDAAYAAQAALSDWFAAQGGGPVGGYKIGATNPAMQGYLGIHEPVYGRILRANLLPSGTRIDGCRAGDFGIEPEIAFRIGRDLPLRDDWTRDAISAEVDAVAPALEIVENRYGDFAAAGLGLLTADDFFQRAAVLGDWCPPSGTDLGAVTVTATIDDAEAGRGAGAAVMGHPAEPLAWLANALARAGLGLKAGDVVLTGSMTLVHWLPELPALVGMQVPGLGAVQAELA
jgi:2-keto-4-pentenoate hydratase